MLLRESMMQWFRFAKKELNRTDIIWKRLGLFGKEMTRILPCARNQTKFLSENCLACFRYKKKLRRKVCNFWFTMGPTGLAMLCFGGEHFKLIRSPRIDCKESILPAYVARQAGTTYNPIPTRFLAPIDCSKIPAQSAFSSFSTQQYSLNGLYVSGLS
jgi:hypothetical protein